MRFIDQPEASRSIFYPRRQLGAPPPGSLDVQCEVEPGIRIGGRLFPAGAEAPLVLYFHGNGEIAEDYDTIAPSFLALGLTLLVMDYRGYGLSNGVPSAQALVSDAVACFRALPGLISGAGLRPGRLYVMGRSLGSVAAVEVALHAGEQIAGLILESGIADTFGLLRRRGFRLPPLDEDLDGFGNPGKLRQISTPLLILHGADDQLIPPREAEVLFNSSIAMSKTLEIIPHAGHNDIALVGFRQYFEAIRIFTGGG